jgi:hypothetical protein
MANNKTNNLLAENMRRFKTKNLNESDSINEFGGFLNMFKQKENADDHYIRVNKWAGKSNVKLISRLEAKNVNGVVTFNIDAMQDLPNGSVERVGRLQVFYKGRKTALTDNGFELQISDAEQTRLLNKYFGGTISRGPR